MTPSKARSTLVDLLTAERDLAPALRALGVWDAVSQVVPRPKAMATIHVNALLDNVWCISGRYFRLRKEARETERTRVLEMFRAIAVDYGDAHHIDIEVVDTDLCVKGSLGREVWKWGLNIAGLDGLAQYEPLIEHLELEDD